MIKGEISNLESSYILASHTSADTLAIDTIQVDKKGKFRYYNTIDTLTVFTLYFNDFKTSAVVFADKDQKITLSGDASFPDLIKINGNQLNDDITAFKKENEDLLTQRGRLLQNIHQDNQILPDSNAHILPRTEQTALLNSLNHELTLKAEDYIKEHPQKMASLILASDFFGNTENPQALERVLGYLNGDLAKSSMALGLKAYAEKISRSAEGVSMPYFQVEDKSDKKITSSDFSGKYLLLSFVSAAGEESRQAIRTLKESYRQFDKKFNKDSVQFISIYIDSDIYPVAYLEKDSIPWMIVAEKKSWASEIVDAYNVQFIPYNILITPSGIIKDRNIPSQEVNNAIKNSAAKATPKN